MAGRMKLFLIMIVMIIIAVISLGVELELLSHPQNADVFINKVWRGNTPLKVDLSPGSHTIKINKNGYQLIEEPFDIRMPTVLEYNLIPLEEISDEFPLVLYLTNYQQSGSRRFLYRENEDQLIEALQKRFENMGFSITVEKPVDEFDLIMDNISIYNMLSQRHPNARLFMIVNAIWSYSSFREKKITKLETQFRIYDPKTSINLGNYQDISESIGLLGTDIAILQSVEKATQNFLDNIGNYMVERVRKDVTRPILASSESYQNGQLYIVKSDKEINELKLYDENETLIERETPSIDSLPINIIFLVDRSGSNEKEIPLIKTQIESLLQILPKKFEWSLMGFDDKVEIIQSFTDDFIQWEFAKDQIVSSGMTRLYDALFNAATVLTRREGLKIVILLTDGIDSDYYDTGLGSIRTEAEALNAISRSGMIVYPIGISQTNHESLLERIAYLSTTDYHDINNYQPDELSNIIARDLTYTIATAVTDENTNPKYFSINSYRYEKEKDSRFLNQKTLIRDFKTQDQPELESEPVKEEEEEEEVITDTQDPTPVKNEEKITETREPTSVNSEVVSEEESESKEKLNEDDDADTTFSEEDENAQATQTISDSIKKDTEKNPVVVESEKATEAEQTATQAIEKKTKTTSIEQTQETQISFSEESTENMIDFPSAFKQILNLKEIGFFDLDKNGNLVWAQDELLYFYIPEEKRIAGISLSSELHKISFHYPYLSIQLDNKVKTLQIKENNVVEINSIEIEFPLAFLKIINEDALFLGYENGTIQAHSLNSDIMNEWQLESGVINQAVIDEKGRIILSTTTARVGWLENMNAELSMIKIEKPVVGLCPFDVDQERFLIVDASGSVYFQRFENTKPTIRNLNRGIVLKASFAEANNILFANHWDKTIRGYRIFDLKETIIFKSKKGIETFDVDSYADKIVIVTVDNELFFYSKNTTIPENLEKIYSIETETNEMDASITDQTELDDTIEEEEVVEEESTESYEGQYDTSINLSEVKKEDTTKSSEMNELTKEEKEEEIAIVLDGKVISGSVDDKKDTPIPTSQNTERELTTEELQGFESIYGSWKHVVAYKDFGYILAGDSNMRIVNPLLQTIKNIPYSKRQLIDSAISKYNILALLFNNRIEIWDIDNLYSTKDISKINSYKFPVSDGKEIVFSRNGEFLLLLRETAELKFMSLDFSRGKNIFSKNEITAINTDMSEGEQFLFGDAKGNVGFINRDGIVSSKNVSDVPISFVFSHKGRSYWVDDHSTVGILGDIQRTITHEKI
ncbi:MAG: VWA domain-containing protein, partial [bacterium]